MYNLYSSMTDSQRIPGNDAISKPLLELIGLFPREPVDPWGEADAALNDSYDPCGDVDNMLAGLL